MYLDDGLTPSEIADLLKWDWRAEEKSPSLNKPGSGKSSMSSKAGSKPGSRAGSRTPSFVGSKTGSRTSLVGSKSSLRPIREVECWATMASRLGVDRISKINIKILGSQQEMGVTKYAVQIAGPDGSYILHRRYTEFEKLYREIFGEEAGTLQSQDQDVTMPPKSFWKKTFSREFLMDRERRLGEVAAAALAATADADLSDCPPGLKRFLGWDEGSEQKALQFSLGSPETQSTTTTLADSEVAASKDSSWLLPWLKSQLEADDQKLEARLRAGLEADDQKLEVRGLNLGRRHSNPNKFEMYLPHLPNSPGSEGSVYKQKRLKRDGKNAIDQIVRISRNPPMVFSPRCPISRCPAPLGSSERGCFAAPCCVQEEIYANQNSEEEAHGLFTSRSCGCFLQALDTPRSREEGCSNKPNDASPAYADWVEAERKRSNQLAAGLNLNHLESHEDEQQETMYSKENDYSEHLEQIMFNEGVPPTMHFILPYKEVLKVPGVPKFDMAAVSGSQKTPDALLRRSSSSRGTILGPGSSASPRERRSHSAFARCRK